MNGLAVNLSFLGSPEFEKATIVLALACMAVVTGLFAYLGRATARAHFKMWASASVFYAMHLAALLAYGIVPDKPHQSAVLAASIGISALFMLWGSLELIERPRSKLELALAVAVLSLWSYASVQFVQDPFWLITTVCLLFGGAMLLAAFFYFRLRAGSRGTTLLALAFSLWGLQAFLYPFLRVWPGAAASTYLTSSGLALMIAVGMIIQEEWEAAEKKYRSVLDTAKEAIFLVDLWSLQTLDANKAAQQLTKRSQQELLDSRILDWCPDLREAGDNSLDHRAMFNAVFKPYNDFHVSRSDGTFVLCEGDTHLVQWHHRPVLQISMCELDTDKKIGQLVRRAEKLSSLGQLVAGVAHELNNPLAVVVGYAQVMARQKCGDERVQANIAKILHESERAAKIVRDLLAFARPCEPQTVVVDLNHVVSNVLGIREADLRANNVLVEKRLASDLPKTKADPIQIEQVLTNLITNAIYALSNQTDSRKLAVATEENGFFIRMTVEDNGPGIPKEILSKIFDPFFTTKPAGKGTGLGLSISNSIMQEHRGKLWVQSEPGKGARFYVELPIVACETETATLPAVNAGAEKKQASDLHLLVVDDEPGIRDVLKEILAATGYVVETAASGTEAVGQISARHFDAVISDLYMPEMDGEKLYRTLRDTNPQLAQRMIFVTGDTVSPKSRTFLEQTGNRWLSKPFNITDVEDAVRTLLEHDPLTMLTGHGAHPRHTGVRRYRPQPS